MKSYNVQKPGGSYLASGLSAENFDSFQRLRTSTPTAIHEAQFTYNLQPLVYEQKTNGTGAAIAHDATNRCVLLTLASTPNNGYSYMQTYNYFHYQPGRSQQVKVTFNFKESVAGATKFVGLTDGTNGFEFQQVGGGVARFAILSATTLGTQYVNQADWNHDRLDGTGNSGITLDLTNAQLFCLDFQALYSGEVRMGFDIDGRFHVCHVFYHANRVLYPYIQYATLPIACGMRATATASTTMLMICSSLVTEGGTSDVEGVPVSLLISGTAGNTVDAHIVSIRPKTTFNSIANRTGFLLVGVSCLVTGNSSISYKLCIGQAISGTTTFADVNTTYSAFEYNTAGTISGSPALAFEGDFVAASATTKGAAQNRQSLRNPITLNAAGAVRANGTLSIIATGITAASACQFAINWKEIR